MRLDGQHAPDASEKKVDRESLVSCSPKESSVATASCVRKTPSRYGRARKLAKTFRAGINIMKSAA
jgi:hypothetical protein